MSDEPKKQHETPCAACPFRRTTAPGCQTQGVSLGGSPSFTYIGQAHGPFWLPCHSTHNYKDPVARRDPSNLQCAGAAIYRANTERDKQLPPSLLHLPKDVNAVFASPVEFLAHHEDIPITKAEEFLTRFTPDLLLKHELSRQGAQVVKPKPPTENSKANEETA